MALSKEKAHERAERYAAKGQHDKAAREYQLIVESDPKDVRAWLMLSDCLVRCGDRPGAIGRYLQVADYYAQLKQPQKALAVYRQVLNLDPTRNDVHLKCAALNMDLGRVHDAIASYEHVASAQLQAGHVREALHTFQIIADADPTVVSKRLRLAELYSREKMVDRAVDAFREAAEQLLAAGRKADYIRVAERLLYHRGEDRASIRGVARAYLTLGDPRRALMKLNGLLQADQRDAEGLELLAETFMALGKPDKAVSVGLELCRELRSKGEKAELERIMSRASQWDPQNSELARLRRDLASVGPSTPSPARAREDSEVTELDEAELLELDEAELLSESAILPSADAEPLPVPVPEPEPAPGLEPVSQHDRLSHSMTESVIEEAGAGRDAPAIESGTDFDKILFEARVYLKYRLFDHALDHVQELLDLDPHHTGALGLRARALSELGRVDEAARTHVEVASLVADRDPKLAREHVLTALDLSPGSSGALALQRRLGDASSVSAAPPPPAAAEPQSATEPSENVDAAAMMDVPLTFDRGDSGAFDLLEDEEGGEISIEVAESDDRLVAAPPVIAVENRFGLSGADALPEAGPGARPQAPANVATETSVVDDESQLPETVPLGNFDLPEPPTSPRRVVRAKLEDDIATDSFPAVPPLNVDQPRVPNAPLPAPELETPKLADLSDELAEIRFFVDQGLDEDAEHALAELRRRHGGHPALEEAAVLLSQHKTPPPYDVGAVPLVKLSSEEDDEADAYLSAIFSEEGGPRDAKPSGTGPVAELEEADPRTHFDLGMAYREMGLVDAAISQFESAAIHHGWQSRALVMIGTLRVHQGQTVKAAEDLQSAIDSANTEDERCEASYELGLLYEKIGDTRAAIAHLRAVSQGFRDRDERLDALQA